MFKVYRMKVAKRTNELQDALQSLGKSTKETGFVPTMGALHQGHLSLVSRATQENDITVVSIYVNPTQFNNADDLKNYPSTLDDDLKKLERAGVDVVFVPDTGDMYPNGATAESFDFNGLDKRMEGAFRPGHFQGMATIVKRLFNAVMPNRAYFGEKDFQQLLLIQKLVAIEGMDIAVVGCATDRELDGLAMSSRNLRLSAQQRAAAPVIYETLAQIKDRAQTDKSLNRSISKAIERINAHAALAVEYVDIVNEETLEPIQDWSDALHARAFAAVFAGDVRLIDNIKLY